MDSIDLKLLEIIQRQIPLTREPFRNIAEALGTSSQDVKKRIQILKSDGIIRQIGAIFDSSKLGYQSLLVAFYVDENRVDEVGNRLSKHEGISHCYARNGVFNLWFTITLPSSLNINNEVAELAEINNVSKYMLLPSIKVYKIGVFFEMNENSGNGSLETLDNANHSVDIDINKEMIRALQRDLPIVDNPFDIIAQGAGFKCDELLDYANLLLKNGVMRRYAAVLRHQAVGYKQNAMICWQIPCELLDEVGRLFAQHPSVSHCYLRQSYDDWPYQIYTMIHARSQEELQRIINELEEICANCSKEVLLTIREYKKARVKYFI